MGRHSGCVIIEISLKFLWIKNAKIFIINTLPVWHPFTSRHGIVTCVHVKTLKPVMIRWWGISIGLLTDQQLNYHILYSWLHCEIATQLSLATRIPWDKGSKRSNRTFNGWACTSWKSGSGWARLWHLENCLPTSNVSKAFLSWIDPKCWVKCKILLFKVK